MQKIRPFIIVDLRLKTRIFKLLIELVVEELNIDKKLVYENLDLLIEYSLIEIELQKYIFKIPCEELNKYRKLKYQKKRVFEKIRKLIV